MDLRAHEGTNIRASHDGVVISRDFGELYGLHVVIEYGDYEMLYAHLSEAYVLPRESVVAGEVIGLAGNTGKSHGAHLHFGLKYLWEWVDPAPFLSDLTR